MTSRKGNEVEDFDIASASAYWRFAPSGAGKHDTSAMLRLDDMELCRAWDEGFVKRFRQYQEEDQFVRQMSGEFAGKRILSIGSGLGLHEIYYQLRGAAVTCCDIVDSNLAVIARVAAAKGAQGMRFIRSDGPDHALGGPYDVIFVYGSLMTMPEPLQRRLARQCLASLTPQGSVVTMLYTWEFARATCGWSSPREFDAQKFARASDPSVGDEHCPWSDWHDDEKLRLIFGNSLHVWRRQYWNQGWYVWYELRPSPATDGGEFFNSGAMPRSCEIHEIDLREFRPGDALAFSADPGVRVKTGYSNFGYALTSEEREGTRALNAIAVDADLAHGAFSVGLLDVANDRFVFAQAVWQMGRRQHLFAFDRLPSRYQVVISNHQPGEPGDSQFVLYRIALFDRVVFDAPPKRI
jgi:SAM-dependent methyltransferase